jgi:hypothetical protein
MPSAAEEIGSRNAPFSRDRLPANGALRTEANPSSKSAFGKADSHSAPFHWVPCSTHPTGEHDGDRSWSEPPEGFLFFSTIFFSRNMRFAIQGSLTEDAGQEKKMGSIS